MLTLWWVKKYKLPWNHELLLSRTLFDLMVEYELDYFQERPLEAHRREDGHVQFSNTGDDLIDKWEAEIAEGRSPDLFEGFTEQDKATLRRLQAQSNNQSIGGSFADVQDSVDRANADVVNRVKYKSMFGSSE